MFIALSVRLFRIDGYHSQAESNKIFKFGKVVAYDMQMSLWTIQSQISDVAICGTLWHLEHAFPFNYPHLFSVIHLLIAVVLL